jgi:hypothetical protein
MESNFRNRDFEEYIKENADQYRMFPSEKIWKNINSTLHTRRKWYGFGLSLLLLLTGTAVTWVMVSYPVSKDQPIVTAKSGAFNPSNQSTIAKEIPAEVIDKVMPFKKAADPASASREMALATPRFEMGSMLPTETPRLVTTLPVDQTMIRNDRVQVLPINLQKITAENAPASPVFYDDIMNTEYVSRETKATRRNSEYGVSHRPSAASKLYYPASIENVASTYLAKNIINKISWQFYVTPTISYRHLNDNKEVENQSAPPNYVFAAMGSDVNKAVTHKPDMGLQVGLSARYPVSPNLKIRGGLQFNINRYDIKAFDYSSEVATINLNDETGINPISTWTNFRTYNGYQSNWLKNYYFSVSAPIGVELKVLGNDRTNVGMAGTIQPTYIIKDRTYVISTDHKNYAKVPSLIRHVNVNVGFETFVNYVSGKNRWQIGPQVRYQVLSSFNNNYSVKENLFDFGVKVGLTLD